MEYENMDDRYRLKAEKVRMQYASTWDHMKQAFVGYAEEQKQLAKGALRAVTDFVKGLVFIDKMLHYAERGPAAAVIVRLSPQPPEWAEKMLGESQEYFGPIAEALTHPVDAVKAMVQETSDTYETEGLEYTGAYVVADIMIGKAVTSGISKAAGKGAGAVDEIGDVANKADDVADVAETAEKMDDVVDAARTAEKTGDVAELAGKGSNKSFKKVKTFTAEETNQWFVDNVKPDYKTPYKPGTTVTEIELIQDITFVRVYDRLPDGSGMYGSWVMKAEDIKGLTPLEIQNKFALPNTPVYVCDVELKAGTHIRVGEVNPLESWGSGGGTQFDLIGQRTGEFMNERLLEVK